MSDSAVICIGHRGAKGYRPENTLPSFEYAIELGSPWIELDVWYVEGELIVIHDADLSRTTNGEGEVMDSSLEYLCSLDAGEGNRIPTLTEVLDLIDRRARVNVELKGPETAAPVNKLLDHYLAAGWSADDFLISSFNHPELAQANPVFKRGALFGKPLPDQWERAERLEAWSVNFNKRLLTRDLVLESHKRGYKVLTYTVNDVNEIRQVIDLGVDGIFTDYPDRVLNL